MKNPMTPAGIEPATFRFVAQYLNPCAMDGWMAVSSLVLYIVQSVIMDLSYGL